jgi:hypothetical protein
MLFVAKGDVMKLGYLFYGCGIALLLVGVGMIVLGVVEGNLGESWALGKIIAMFFFGVGWMRIGANRLVKARLERLMAQLKQVGGSLNSMGD